MLFTVPIHHFKRSYKELFWVSDTHKEDDTFWLKPNCSQCRLMLVQYFSRGTSERKLIFRKRYTNFLIYIYVSLFLKGQRGQEQEQEEGDEEVKLHNYYLHYILYLIHFTRPELACQNSSKSGSRESIPMTTSTTLLRNMISMAYMYDKLHLRASLRIPIKIALTQQ